MSWIPRPSARRAAMIGSALELQTRSSVSANGQFEAGGPVNERANDGSGSDVVVVTGMSRPGRGTAAKLLARLGSHTPKNLPPELISRVTGLRRETDPPIRRL